MMKGVLTADDPFFDQVRIILTDAMTRSKELIDEESHQKLKQEVYKYSTAQFTVAELTKIIKEYKQQARQS